MGKKNRGPVVPRLCGAVLEARLRAGLPGFPWEADVQQPRLNARTQMLEEGRKAPGP